ncbi:hypothetical protein A1O7_04582 [Cladophialophora yegresii CBS 114405]|uniref:Velvet domain-containing protein n=1 Tax=Cladophialophora yegresii CBS 114405 TaxID=1182544 RepID=W9W609_9EURO|nr:uncharacterized protein A1O7_04582 [Cladophialophora yegresii CBS 114405]EXJ60430.1 hypothetical protein A1O7_04582 [Cladophialophora yegresii CBS 114405]
MEKSLAPPRDNLFCGKRADSVHPVYHEQEVDRPTTAYAIFPDLVIKEPGSYRVKVSIIDMNGYASARQPIWGTMLIYVRAISGVTAEVHSKVFDVVEETNHSGSEPKVDETIGRLRSIGINC